MKERDGLETVIQGVTDLWDEPLDAVHDVPPIVNAILASDWLAEHDAEVREGVLEEIRQTITAMPPTPWFKSDVEEALE